MNDDDYYGKNGALSRIDDLTPFIALADRMKQLSDQGRINDMRRELVKAFVRLHRQELSTTKHNTSKE